MDYKKKYEYTLERAKRMFSEKELNYLFPELKESEDDRIRKAIHIYLDWLDGRNKDYQPKGDYSIKDMVAWLEKQGEQKSQRMISAEAKEAMYDKPAWSEDKWIESLIQTFEDGYFEGFNQLKSYGVIDLLKSLKERIE